MQVLPEEHNSVDEMIIPFKGKFSSIKHVDLLDSFSAKYKFPMKSGRWYMYIFWHTIILAVINAWLLYKRDCMALKMPKQKILIRRRFQVDLASSLILVRMHFCYLQFFLYISM